MGPAARSIAPSPIGRNSPCSTCGLHGQGRCSNRPLSGLRTRPRRAWNMPAAGPSLDRSWAGGAGLEPQRQQHHVVCLRSGWLRPAISLPWSRPIRGVTLPQPGDDDQRDSGISSSYVDYPRPGRKIENPDAGAERLRDSLRILTRTCRFPGRSRPQAGSPLTGLDRATWPPGN